MKDLRCKTHHRTVLGYTGNGMRNSIITPASSIYQYLKMKHGELSAGQQDLRPPDAGNTQSGAVGSANQILQSSPQCGPGGGDSSCRHSTLVKATSKVPTVVSAFFGSIGTRLEGWTTVGSASKNQDVVACHLAGDLDRPVAAVAPLCALTQKGIGAKTYKYCT